MKIVVTQRIHPEIAELLSAHGTLIANDSLDPWPRAQLLDHARDAHALMVFMPDSLDDAFLAACPDLRIVAAALKGPDNFDIQACTQRGIWFTLAGDLLSEPTAELALALMLGLARNIAPGDRHIRAGQFQGWRPTLYGTGLAGSTVGLIGYGAVARALAGMLQGFTCEIQFHDPAHPGSIPLDQLLASSDFILPLVPLTPATLHLINTQTLRTTKRGAYLINVSRGSVVDEAAIAAALESGQLSGYAADTFEMEDWARPRRPREIHPRLLALTDRTLFTPHLGSAVASVRKEIERAAASNIIAALEGRRPPGAVNSPATPRNAR
ncbi:MAG TPA: NAD(P)-dependent oxidoreductase [Bryobacteraceae bacterium]|nr:NAD(P)-dependent oxidoreductase [Bryobacteraceae bacterium]